VKAPAAEPAGVVARASSTRWFRVLAGAGALAVAVSYLFNPTMYRIDLEVYRAGGRAWLDGAALYANAFPTQIGSPLKFTYPPISAVLLSPLAWMPLNVANAVWAVLTLGLLIATLVVFAPVSGLARGSSAWWWVLVAAFAVTARLEPVRSTMGYGQINVLLMALVAADCLLVRTRWPRGAVVGAVAAVKLTPAVFVLYFLIRRDYRAAVTSAVSGALVTALGFALAPADSVTYWSGAVTDTGRIGSLAYASNQNLQAVIARSGLVGTTATVLWLICALGVLALGCFAMRQAHRAGLAALVLVLNATVGLLISPVSWSHHWVWAMPALLVLGALVATTGSRAAGALVAVGLVIFAVAPHWRLPNDTTSGVELNWVWWQQVVGNSYVWWGLALLAVCARTAHRWGPPVPGDVDGGAVAVPTGAAAGTPRA